MFKWIYIKTEFKKIFREPIMLVLLLAPLLIPVIFRLLMDFFVPFILRYVTFDISLYEKYILGFTLIISAMLLSIVIGFSMIDDRDNRIVELISITPFSKSGYVIMRLAIVFVLVIFYSLYAFFVLNLKLVPLSTLLYLSLLLSIYSAVMGLLLFSVATDKVNGLTYAKGLNAVALFAFVDLLNIKWLKLLGGFFPSYWVTQIIGSPQNVFYLVMGAVVSIAWLAVFIARTKF